MPNTPQCLKAKHKSVEKTTGVNFPDNKWVKAKIVKVKHSFHNSLLSVYCK